MNYSTFLKRCYKLLLVHWLKWYETTISILHHHPMCQPVFKLLHLFDVRNQYFFTFRETSVIYQQPSIRCQGVGGVYGPFYHHDKHQQKDHTQQYLLYPKSPENHRCTNEYKHYLSPSDSFMKDSVHPFSEFLR